METPTHHIEPVEVRNPVVETASNEVHQGSQVQDVAITTPVRRSIREIRSAIPLDVDRTITHVTIFKTNSL